MTEPPRVDGRPARDYSPLSAALAGRYRIERELGRGGMATVYLAEDIRHKRRVALKVLDPELAAVIGAERFLTEITTTANLQHPHILPLHDSGTIDGTVFYVMPFVEGESLRDRIAREKQLPIADSVRIAREVADALDYAHRHGVIHRDIKPENILLHDGRAVVADFGIALAASRAEGGSRLTETGMSLGTPHYMSPEQAMGERDLDGRTDVYALGCVLYEMIAGEPPFTGPTAQAIVARVIGSEPPPLTKIRKTVPAYLEDAVLTALQKIPADRFATAGAFAAALDGSAATATRPLRHQAAVSHSGRRGMLLPAALVAMSVVAIWAWLRPRPTSPNDPVVRFTVKVGETEQRYLGSSRETGRGIPQANALALSPDGTLLVYAAWSGSGEGITSGLLIRRLNEERAHPIPGTEYGENPFFSPDGKWIGFSDRRSLKRVPTNGGVVETMVSQESLVLRGASWGDDDTILFSASVKGADFALYRVAAAGGVPARVPASDTLLSAGVVSNPLLLPGSRVALVGVQALDPARSHIVALDLRSGRATPLQTNAQHPLFVPSGHLLFLRQGTLMAVSFDPERVAIRGEPVAMQDDVRQTLNLPNSSVETGAGQYAVSASGDLAYASGGVYTNVESEVVRVSSSGRATPLGITGFRILQPRRSPTSNRILFSANTSERSRTRAILSRDVTRGVTTRLTGERSGFDNSRPFWSPDGQRILFASDREGGVSNVYVMPADGGPATRLMPAPVDQFPTSWSSSGVIAFLQDFDIWTIPPGGTPARFFSSSATERHAAVSPDGRWLAYTSNESGREELYVRPYPGPDPAVKLSEGGASSVAWSTDGRRLYYLAAPRPGAPRPMMVVDVGPGTRVQDGRASVLIADWSYVVSSPVTGYDVEPSGSFVAIVDHDGTAADRRIRGASGEVHVVLNFLRELRQRVPH